MDIENNIYRILKLAVVNRDKLIVYNSRFFRKLILLFFIIFLSEVDHTQAQEDTTEMEKLTPLEGRIIPGYIRDGDTVLHINLRQITVLPPFEFKSDRQRRRYSRLVRYVKKVYPYAVLIRQTYFEIQSALDTIPTEKEQKKYIKEKEKELRDKFEDELIHLTILQGRILIKLVDRETGDTTYDVLKEFKGSFSAFFWQSVARIFGSNLKSDYDAEGDDAMIEDIIVRIENGTL